MPREAPALAEVREPMMLGQRLLAALIALAMMFAVSAVLWVWWDLVVL
jgi:hypothetical protein